MRKKRGRQEAKPVCPKCNGKGVVVLIHEQPTREDQDDLFQEILLQLWRSIPGFNSKCNESTWIYRVGLNTALIWRREKTRKREKQHILLDLTQQSYIEQNCGDSSQNSQVLDQLYDAIRLLSKTDSSILLMHLDGLSYDEMSDVFGISKSNVGVRLNRAKKKLAQLLKGLVDDF